MGIPYSRQINAAFDQVTPLVAAGFVVLETTKNIAILLAWIQVLTIILLSLILTSLFGLLITLNPDLEAERRNLVTPVVRWLAKRVERRIYFAGRNWWVFGGVTAFIVVASAFLSWSHYVGRGERWARAQERGRTGGSESGSRSRSSGSDGDDVVAIKNGKAKQ
ncbi:hypothetical protein K402DRAFT_389308 [Aulographum hederae CBS 113979]|uniref:Uncharacterized protein n=1 Tax=Aulographum hederae CBS 113979 TaxID=1176131 RepID=A0A6G1HD00_9PEZI|nr:hypothetical protein K402DRAFT_389308 [Aulographum hederae CBS 113979]